MEWECVSRSFLKWFHCWSQKFETAVLLLPEGCWVFLSSRIPISLFVPENIVFLSWQGVNGAVQYPRNFLKEAYQLIRERGGLCISDEVSQISFVRILE